MSGADALDMACAVCGHVLNRYSGSFGEGWVHALDADKDHPAIAVPEGSIRTMRLCDFCTEPNAGWVLPVEDFTIDPGLEALPAHTSVGDWQCCAGCAALLERGDWNGLARRALAAAKVEDHLEDPELAVFEAIHHTVREHVTGPVRIDRS